MSKLPKISIITPSYNQADYLEDTIQSVIGQNYPNLEHILIDGGSDDGSLDIIKKYDKHFAHWQSQKDDGQSDAINQGFRKATGDIVAWLNSDDQYLPNTLHYIAQQFMQNGNLQHKVVFGNCIKLNTDTLRIRGTNVGWQFKTFDIELTDYIVQPSSFWTREVWQQVGELDEDLDFGMDWDWYIRAKRLNIPYEPTDRFLSVNRFHAEKKTTLGGMKRVRELSKIYKRYHDETTQKAYLKYHENGKYKGFRKWYQRFRLQRLLETNKVLHSLYFKKDISYEKFVNIIRM